MALDLSKPSSLVTFLLDRSGSMRGILPATLEGFNGYLATLKAERDARIDFTLLLFDAPGALIGDRGGLDIEKVCVAKPVAEVPELTSISYIPRGGTPLIDAAIATIRAVEASLAARSDKPKDVICIQTDGEENQSRASWDELRRLVSQKQEQGWEFNFMGAGIDAYQQAQRMGVSAQNTMSYDSADVGRTRAAFGASALNASGFAAGRLGSTVYTAQQREDSGDRFAAAAGVGAAAALGAAGMLRPAPKKELDLTKGA